MGLKKPAAVSSTGDINSDEFIANQWPTFSPLISLRHTLRHIYIILQLIKKAPTAARGCVIAYYVFLRESMSIVARIINRINGSIVSQFPLRWQTGCTELPLSRGVISYDVEAL